jgi:hypothetical protein
MQEDKREHFLSCMIDSVRDCFYAMDRDWRFAHSDGPGNGSVFTTRTRRKNDIEHTRRRGRGVINIRLYKRTWTQLMYAIDSI